MKTEVQGPVKQYGTVASPKCYRFRPDAIPAHAPNEPGIYELVTFDEAQNARVLFIQFAPSIVQNLKEHLSGAREPKVENLLAKHLNLYFDFVLIPEASQPQDWQDAVWALAQEHKPPYNNLNEIRHSGRFSSVELKSLPPAAGNCRGSATH